MKCPLFVCLMLKLESCHGWRPNTCPCFITMWFADMKLPNFDLLKTLCDIKGIKKRRQRLLLSATFVWSYGVLGWFPCSFGIASRQRDSRFIRLFSPGYTLWMGLYSFKCLLNIDTHFSVQEPYKSFSNFKTKVSLTRLVKKRAH